MALVGLVVAGWLAPAVVEACSCVSGREEGTPGDIRRAVARADAVFEGRVREASGDPMVSRYVLDVRRTWKGQLGAQVTIRGIFCLRFEKGEHYVVFAYKLPEEPGAFTASWCGYTSGIGGAHHVIEVLGDGRLPPGTESCAVGGQSAAGPMLVLVLGLRRRRVTASAGGSGRARCVGR